MKLIDGLKAELKGFFNETSENNYVKIFDTPHVWGMPFGKEIMPKAIEREAEFEQAITSILDKMLYRCDISSLNAPDEEWRKIILAAIDKSFSEKKGRKERTQIRFLFAQTPTVLLNGVKYYFSGTPEYLALKKDLIELIKERGKYWECIPDIWIGRFYRIIDGLKVSLEKKVLPEDFISELDTRMTWNHTKIIAVDGSEAFVGGHNLNMDLFKSYPPVHDVSVKVIGESALHSQLFLNNMWDVGKDLITKEYFDSKKNEWVAKKASYHIADPLTKKSILKEIKKINEENLAKSPDEGFFKTDRIFSVGKYWKGPDMRVDYKKGSEKMKEYLIKHAKKKIRMSQQDVMSAWKKKWKDHPVCHWIIEALLKNPELEVEIVVSPLDAAAGANGDQYSFGSGAQRTFELFKYYLTHDIETDAVIPDPDKIRESALRRIKIAPFFFTDKVPKALQTEGKTYKWPDADESSYTATLKEAPLSEDPPKKGDIGHPFWSLVNASGIYPKVAPAPGNHAKVTIIDDELYIVGSDNMYPGYLSEFNYLVEGEEAVSTFIKEYWDKLWHYSEPHAFKQK